MSRKYPRLFTRYMKKEYCQDIDTYMHHQREEMKSITNMVEGLFDGWPIDDWDMYWDPDNKRWTIDIYPDMDNVDPTEYFHNR